MNSIKGFLPKLIFLENHKGDYSRFIEEVYSIFKMDFVDSKPIFRGKSLGLKIHPLIQGKEYTFYHFTNTGPDENDRKPDIRRCERIGWAKPSIEKCDEWSLKVWPQKRNGKNRICIWLECENEPDYIVILEVKNDYILPWTAFTLDYNNAKRKKQKEYEEYIKSKNRSIS
jgi:hypothetical protein